MVGREATWWWLADGLLALPKGRGVELPTFGEGFTTDRGGAFLLDEEESKLLGQESSSVEEDKEESSDFPFSVNFVL